MARVTERVDCIVVGAGAAGIAAAAALARGGHSVVVLEARGRTGGRVLTVRDESMPVPIELGAEFLHGAPDRLLRAAEEAREPVCEVDGTRWRVRDGRVATLQDFWQRLARVMHRVRDDVLDDDLSVRDAIAEAIPRRELVDERRLALQFVQGFHAADPAVASAKALAAEGPWEDESARRMHRVLLGYDRLLAHLMKEIEPAIRLNAVVDRIVWRRGSVRVRSTAGTFMGRTAIVTVPVGVLQAPRGAPGAITFSPAVPRLRAVLRGLAVGNVVRVAVEVRERFWEDESLTPELTPRDRETATFLHTDDPEFPVWWTTNPVRAPLLVAWSGGPSAARVTRKLPRDERALPAAARRHVVAALARQLGRPQRWVAARVGRVWAHDWGRDPYARGAYTYPRAGGGGVEVLRQPIAGTLAFAGEALAPDGENATVHGALQSGEQAAKALGPALRRR